MLKYEINRETAAIIGLSKKETKVLENNNEYIIKDNAFNVMDHSCKYFGSSYNGRIEGSKNILGFNYKLPILVEEYNNSIFFPIKQIDDPTCIWISLNLYDRVVQNNKNTIIYFKNGKKITVNVSKNIINNQVLKSSRLKYIISDRKI